MTEITLLQAHQRFASALATLHAKQLQDFDAWLKPARARARHAGFTAEPERAPGARKHLAQDFVHDIAPSIVRDLNRGAERDSLDALRGYEAQFEPPSTPQAALPDYRWRPSLWRTAIGAAFGAVIGVVLFAIDHVAATPPAPTSATQQLVPAP